MAKKVVIDAGHQGIGVSQIWRIAIRPSKYKKFKMLLKKCLLLCALILKMYKFDDIMYIGW